MPSEPQTLPTAQAPPHLVWPYSRDALPYGYDALEPYIDAETMRVHHDLHHWGYVERLNQLLEPYPELQRLTIEQLLRSLDRVPEVIRTAVQNQGGGHANHQFYWKIMKANGGGTPTGALVEALSKDFGSFANFQTRFTEAAVEHFGAGWTFLVLDPQTNRLDIVTLPNQESVLPLKKPGLLCCDLWEHAYYLRYRNRRAEYIQAWWNVVAWSEVEFRLQAIRSGEINGLGGPKPRTHSL